MKKFAATIAIALVLLPSAVLATECAVEYQNAEEAVRERYINGMTGLASANYSTRPGTYSSMACLDKFMQGEMDIFFRPPDLDSLLQQALSFACENIAEVMGGVTGGSGGGGTGEVLSLLQTMGSNLSVPGGGGSFNVGIPSGSGINIQDLFGGF